jgi:hypothetical protein
MKISFRKYDFRIHEKNEIIYIFDEVRKKNVKLTPEEWVRQNFLHYLIYDLNYPRNKIAIEKEFKINDRKKRFDLLVFDENTEPFLLLECKSQVEELNEKVLKQCLNYNINFEVPYLVISNGDYTFAWHLEKGSARLLNELPNYRKQDV